MDSDALRLYREQEAELLAKRKSYELYLAELMRAVDLVDRKLSALSEIIKLESEGPELRLEQLSLLATGSDHELAPGVARKLDDDESEDQESQSSTPRRLLKAWIDFVAEQLHEHGPLSVEILFATAPEEVKSAFNKSAAAPPLFRARRMLRRSPNFDVDRNTGIVTMLFPPVPALVVNEDQPWIEKLEISIEPRTLYLYLRERDGTIARVNYAQLIQRMEATGTIAWMTESTGAVHPVAICKGMNKKRSLHSFDSNRWTRHFADWFEAVRIQTEAPVRVPAGVNGEAINSRSIG